MQKAYLFFLLVFTLVLSGQEKLPAIDEKNQESSNFTLYPNPAIDGIVYIKTLNNRSKDVTVYDVFGKIVLQDRISTNMLNIGRLSPGVYVIQVIENNKTMTRKLVVK
ncbi:MAG: T9SS type A sorting domain-containing protein [Eudoraea sp.]|uniref:T9SS type A sorting domain-containing protein n=1 Tax=Eudoraea sp. TaxID=1979955 RepID=UPI003C7524F2